MKNYISSNSRPGDQYIPQESVNRGFCWTILTPPDSKDYVDAEWAGNVYNVRDNWESYIKVPNKANQFQTLYNKLRI